MKKLFSIKKFSEISGISVRTLHYYDEINLLKPTTRELNNGYRMYSNHDLLILQRILVLKSVGYKLDNIRNLICNQQLDLSTALELQLGIINQQIYKLKKSSNLINHMLEKSKLSKDINWNSLALLCKETNMNNNINFEEWINHYFNAKELEQFKKLRESFSPTFWEDYSKKWEELTKKVEANLTLDPASLAAKKLLDEWMDLVNKAYKDYPEIKEKMWDAIKLGATSSQALIKQNVIDFIEKISQLYK